MASDAACIDSAAGSMCPFAQFHGGGGADESGQLPVDADSKEGVLVQILMRQSRRCSGVYFFDECAGFQEARSSSHQWLVSLIKALSVRKFTPLT